jgi:hypothetical protein
VGAAGGQGGMVQAKQNDGRVDEDAADHGDIVQPGTRQLDVSAQRGATVDLQSLARPAEWWTTFLPTPPSSFIYLQLANGKR